MANAKDGDFSSAIVYRIDNAVVAGSNPPQILCSAQLLTTIGPWLVNQAFDFFRTRRTMLSVSASSSLRAEVLNSMLYLGNFSAAF
jgi:hypothetical protein